MAALQLLGALGLLIYGMRMMSEALQKMAGPQLRHILAKMTTNRITGMLTGTLVTCAVQSSSATTVMTVSFVSAGLLTLAQAISVIMGANIGTTLTAWIMSLGYNVDLTSVVYPSFLLGMVLIYKKRHRYVGDFLFGTAFMFLSLVMLSATGKAMDLEHNEAVVAFFASFDTSSHLTILAFLAIGTLITCIVQSSAAVMAITILLCSTGVLPIYLGIALVMGENIGTPATANLVALGANTQARRAALAHLLQCHQYGHPHLARAAVGARGLLAAAREAGNQGGRGVPSAIHSGEPGADTRNRRPAGTEGDGSLRPSRRRDVRPGAHAVP